ANRGANTVEKARECISGTMADLHDPALLKDADKLVTLLAAAIERGEKIAVSSDYDADGIFSGTILKTALERLGAEVRVYTPDRITEGYGMNRRIVEDAKAFGAGVIITCDNGISAYDAVGYAKSLGMTVLVTDHHEQPAAGLPAADAVVDPKQEGDAYPFPGICGAFVAYKLMCLLYRRLGRLQEETDDLIPYAAIATVTDVMDLVDENRILVREGLKMLEKTAQPGLRAMITAAGLEGRKLTAYHLGFVLGPCFNAAGRLENVDIVQQLLAAGSVGEAMPFAQKLQDLNGLRKALTEEGCRAAREAIANEGFENDRILTVHLPDVHESVAGIVAGRLKEELHRPVLVITGRGAACKGSGRSIEAFDMFAHMEACGELFSRFGGHAMAAGFSLPEENIGVLRKTLNEGSGLTDDDLLPTVQLDAAMPPEYATPELIREWDGLGPFGTGFARPLFGRGGLLLENVRVLGQNRNALRLRFRGESGRSFEGIWFGDVRIWEKFLSETFGEKCFTMLERGQTKVRLALAYEPVLHEYEGRKSLQFQIRHFHA
ncbi:MAG: single-stranded-DNA-specific exonuclease RecJ, partial [Lachnospiraceae bacterium]|nr:single-stranded-DNA-specific exonuclease RecJ [Lachnospiraceae bacterium]